jgi:phosphoribosylanthranilate isomerase
MKYPDNIKSVAALQPDYLGFIFYEKSKRHFNGVIPEISESIKKTGVFVNATIKEITKKIIRYDLNVVQLHGDESAELCQKLKQRFSVIKKLEIIKVFSVGYNFDFNLLKPYDEVCDYFLFDTKGKERGGNGITFNWKLLQNYSSEKSYFLSGGIGLEEVEDLKYFFKSTASKYCYAIDVNSKFEIKPGLKNIEKLKNFIKNLEL